MLEVFQQFGFPIAVAIVSLMAIGFLGKYLLNRMDKMDAKAEKIQEQYTAYLQMSNVELTGALKENAMALKDNASALSKFSASLERFDELLVKLNNKIN
ncbi:MAG: hypothetical protein II852_00010 [Bacteroidales bacterium]|nr:hypothetical protein [Bacteroidales bacterium]MBQ4434251.1 hypothetical protein [Bacteroidales bacterium]